MQKFAGIIYRCPPTSGEVRDDSLMDLYNARMHHEYSGHLKNYPKDLLKTFDKLMKSYHFLSKHPKFEVEFPPDGSKPPPKHPNSMQKADLSDHLSNTILDSDFNEMFVRSPNKKERPAGREYSNRVDEINIIMDKLSQQVNTTQDKSSPIQEMWSKIESAIKLTSEHMHNVIKNQAMYNAPSPIKEAYFNSLSRSITAEVATQAENCKKACRCEKKRTRS